MIYDVSSPQFQQFLRTSNRRTDAPKGNKSSGGGKVKVSKPAGAASTGL